MPYKKRTYKKKKRYTRRRGNNGWNLANKALATANFVKKMLNVEYKEYETSTTNAVNTNAGTLYNIFTPGQGTAVNQREGDSCKMINLTLEGCVTRNSADDNFRMIIFIDKQNDVTATSQILENTSDAQVIWSNKPNDYKYQTKVLIDKVYTVHAYRPIQHFRFVIPLKKHVHFDLGGGSPGVVADNAIKIATFSQLAATGAYFTYHSHISFVDN